MYISNSNEVRGCSRQTSVAPLFKNTIMKKYEIKKEIEATRKRLQDLERKLDEPEEKSWEGIYIDYRESVGDFGDWSAASSLNNPLFNDFRALSIINYYVHGGEFYEFREGDRNYYMESYNGKLSDDWTVKYPVFGVVYFSEDKIEQAKQLFEQYLETKNK